MRELQAVEFDSSVFTDEKLLYKTGLIDSNTLSKNLTYLWGKDSDMFPLLTATQGQGAFSSVKPTLLNDTQYTWPVMGRPKWTTNVIGLAETNANPGKNFALFDIFVDDNNIHYQYSAYTPDHKHQVRFMSEPRREGVKKYRVTCQILTGDKDAYIAADNFVAGRAWAMGPTSVAAQLSDGTTSNRMFPGKMTNQFGFQRYSKPITGNITNKVVNIELDVVGGGTTNMWLPFEMKQWEMERRMLDEIDLWYSTYNRDANGIISNLDSETNLPIPKGAGVREIIKSAGNYDTYGILTKAKFDNTVRAVYNSRPNNDTFNEIVLYTGLGGAEAFHNMLMNESSNYVLAMGDKIVTGDGSLQFGNYFNRYKTIDNKIITVRLTKMFDYGIFAEQDRLNGRMYNGLPLSSYTMVFLDHTVDSESGERNIQLVAEQGREEITGVYVGLTNIPEAWKSVIKREGQLSTTKDKASFEVMTSRGINFLNCGLTSFWLDMEL